MAIDLATGFNIGSKDAIDERQVLTLEQMKNLDETVYPDKYFAICKDNGKLYLYDADNEINDETGKFRVLEGSVIGDGTVDLTGYKKTYTSESELFVDSKPNSIYDIIVKLKEGEMFLDYTRYYNTTWFPTSGKGVFRIIKGGYEDFSDTTVEWFGSSGAHAIAVLNVDVGVERWNVLGGTGKSVYSRKITLGIWNLLARIKLSSSANTKHILSFSCLNQVPNGVDYVFNKDADLCKYELHFTVPDLTSAYNSTKLTQFGLVLYEYPIPEGTADGLKNLSKNIGLYYDREDLSISIFIINSSNENYLGRYIGSKLMNVSLEYTGEGTIVESLQSNGYTSWGQVSWNEICEFEDLEYPTIVSIGGDGGSGSTEGTKTYTSLSELGLTEPVSVSEIFKAMVDNTIAMIGCEDIANHITDVPTSYGILTIKRKNNSRFSIDYQNSLGGSATNVRRWIGTLKGSDGSGLYWKELQTDIGVVITSDIITKHGTEILKYPVGTWRIDSANIGNQFTDLPYTETAGIIEIDSIQPNRSPYEHSYGYRNYTFRSALTNMVYTRTLNSGNTVGTMQRDSGWQQIHTKKEDDSYIPDMYDRNANGDIPVVGFDRLANCVAVRANRGLVSTTETEATYDEDYVGGYVFSGANDVLIKDKEMFNKIKVLVHIPGVLRIGIVNEKIYEANPRYSTCLVKWLVADFVAFTGMKEYDIADTVLEEGQSIFLECRTGVSSWYLNTGEATQVGMVTYPANSCTTGLNVADKLDTTTNNALFKSQKVNSSSCLTSFGSGMYSIGGKIRGNFKERAYNSGVASSKETDENTEYFGGLNIGLYRRTKYSDTRVCKCIENGMNNSWVGDNNVTKIYAPYGQEKLVSKSVYAFKLDVKTPGNLTIYHLKGKSLDTVQVIDKYTHYVRAKGLQTIHLPFDIKINSTDEYIGFGGLHCKSTSDNIVKHSCCWHYLDTSQAKWMTTIDNSAKQFYSIGVSNTVYPEKFTSFEINSNYLNIELICRGEKRSPLEDKYISFTGDSITTFAGFCTTQVGYPEGNPAGDNAVYYPASGKVINNVDATWWGILARDNRMKILRNDAWSGSRVSSSEGSTDTRCLCGDKRRYYLRNGYDFATNSTYPFGRPEIIVSMIGTNDLSGGVELGQEMFTGITGAEEEYKTILSAFSLFCRRIHEQEGQGGTKIVHFLIPRGSSYGYTNANGVTIADLSLHFERIAKAYGQYFIPLSYFNGIRPSAPKRWSCPTGNMFKNTSGVEFPSADGLHPNAMGMEVIADGVHRFLCSII